MLKFLGRRFSICLLPSPAFKCMIHSLYELPLQQQDRALLEAQLVLTEYLHSTRSLSFTYAECIGKNSPSSLINLLSKFKFSISNVSRSLQRFLSYHPINEFEFFFESIGISAREIPDFLPPQRFFLNEGNENLLLAVRTLVEYGFPWDKLGVIYKEEGSVFNEQPTGLMDRLCRMEALGFDRFLLIGCCLAFPSILSQSKKLDGEAGTLLALLKSIFYDLNFLSCTEGNVDVIYGICKKIKVFYNLGCENQIMGNLIARNSDNFMGFTEDAIVKKVDFFLRFGMKKENVGSLILQHPKVLNFALEDSIFTINISYLRHIGLKEKQLDAIISQYPHVLGKNRLENLPEVMKALDLQDWFADRILKGDHHLLFGYVSSSSQELMDDFLDDIERIGFSTKHHYTYCKLGFLLGIGFGNNMNTIDILRHLHGTRIQLQERFDRLILMGIKHSRLCKMIVTSPKILNQNTDMLVQKVNFLINDMQCSLDHLDAFPSYLYYDLEKRIKPRCKILAWLRQMGAVKNCYSLATVIVSSDKRFLSFLLKIHPAAPKHWLGHFSANNYSG